MKQFRSALRSSFRATKSRRSAPVLAGVVLGAVLAVGTAVPASAASITSCSFSPTHVDVPVGSTQMPTANFTWAPAQAGLSTYNQLFVDDVLVNSGLEPIVGSSGNPIPIGALWSEELAGKTVLLKVHAFDVVAETLELLCSVSITYASAGGGGEFDLDIDRERYLGRSSSVAELPDTV